MSRKVNRREFVVSSAAGIAAAAHTRAAVKAPAVMRQTAKPLVISSANGFEHKNGGPKTGIEIAFGMITEGKDVLDAVIAGVNICELDPEDTSVGYGGLPNADGVVQLDASCMHGPRKRAGGVACIEGVRTPSLVAQKVLSDTDHHLLVGKDAQTFARNMGFKIEPDLNTDRSRAAWLEWKRRTDPAALSRSGQARGGAPPRRARDDGRRLGRSPSLLRDYQLQRTERQRRDLRRDHDQRPGVEDPGRVGDSPILGAGLYVDGDVGAAGSTGRGEANLFSLASFLIVEEMRRGKHPKDAGLEALRRIKANTIEKRLLNSRGEPNFNINFYMLNKKGEYAGVGMYAPPKRPPRFAVCDDKGPRFETCEPLLPGTAE